MCHGLVIYTVLTVVKHVGESTFTFRAFSRRFYPKLTNKYICQEVKQYIAIGTVKMFIELSASTNNRQLTPFPVNSSDS